MRIYVGNLSFDTSEAELNGLFSQYGEVADASLVTDRETGRPRGFGFVEMPDDNAAREAIGGEPRKILTLNNLYGVVRAVEAGIGIAGLPDFLAREMRNLVRILPELEGPGHDAFFVYPEELRASQRIGVFRDFLVGKVAETRF